MGEGGRASNNHIFGCHRETHSPLHTACRRHNLGGGECCITAKMPLSKPSALDGWWGKYTPGCLYFQEHFLVPISDLAELRLRSFFFFKSPPRGKFQHLINRSEWNGTTHGATAAPVLVFEKKERKRNRQSSDSRMLLFCFYNHVWLINFNTGSLSTDGLGRRVLRSFCHRVSPAAVLVCDT